MMKNAYSTNSIASNVAPTAVLSIVIGMFVLSDALGQERDDEVQEAQGQRADAHFRGDRSAWMLREQAAAINRTASIVGLDDRKPQDLLARVVVLTEDNTAFLSDQLLGRPLWHVLIDNWSMDLPSTPPGWKDKYARSLDVFLDPQSGSVLKIATRWPKGIPASAPEPDGESATSQVEGGHEKYLSFPAGTPSISFTEAIDIVQKDGGNPLVAKQITGQWVVWSRMDEKPRPVWVITLRGIPPFPKTIPDKGGGEGVTLLRCIVDPVAKKWTIGSSWPR
ncbi:MAG: PepSY domain-containing protein [Phycisphaerales bacterium]|nr:MAG: PepSY domain-containing protein [Phycisphaerales bacterium]